MLQRVLGVTKNGLFRGPGIALARRLTVAIKGMVVASHREVMNCIFSKLVRVCAASVLLVVVASAQVKLKRGAVVYTGSASNTSAPAAIDDAKVREATAEWKKMESEGIDPDSARGKQLLGKMKNRIRDAVKSVAQDESRDLVVRKDDISDEQGKVVLDLTDKVIDKLGE